MAKVKKIKLPSLKAIGQAVVKYREGRAAGTIAPSATMEAISLFFGKKGQVLKRETRYNTQKQKLLEGVKAVKARYGSHPGKASFKREQQKKSKQTQKAAQTFAEKNVKQKKQGGADKRFKKQAQEKANTFMKAVEVFKTWTYNDLADGSYGIGSDVVIAMAESGLEPEEIETYLKQVKETFDDIPDEAKQLASKDDFWKSIIDITNIINEKNKEIDYRDVVTAYMTTEADTEDFKAALENYLDYGDYSKPFGDVWDDLKDTMDPGNPDTFAEVMESEGDYD